MPLLFSTGLLIGRTHLLCTELGTKRFWGMGAKASQAMEPQNFSSAFN